MKLSAWASVAELISGVAVVVTLVFLILGIQENTEATRASNWGRSVGAMIEFRQTIVNDPEVARIYTSWSAFDTTELDAVESTRLRQLIYMIFNIYEDAFYARDYGVLGESEWSRFRIQICTNWPRMVSSGFDEGLPAVLTPNFMRYIDDLVEGGC
jgi:hypothetical protein